MTRFDTNYELNTIFGMHQEVNGLTGWFVSHLLH